MEKTYWLTRKRASLAMARKAVSSEARLVHYDLAGRYSVNAASATALAADHAVPSPEPLDTFNCEATGRGGGHA